MKKLLNKNNKIIIAVLLISLFLFHLPLMIKNIITADVLLNNSYYNGYAWEISLGRFGTFIVGLLKSYLSFPHVDLIISYILLSLSFILILDLFEIKDKLPTIFLLILIVVSPVISATLLFHFWNIVYFIAFFLSISSIYLYYKAKNKYLKYLVPLIFIIGSLSFYQAYLSFIVSLFIFYNIHLILKKKINYKECIKYIGLILCGIICYFILMKLSQIILHIDMANYSNANGIGISTILSIPSKIIDSYKLFYQFFFANSIMKNTYFHNNIFNLLLLICFTISYAIAVYKSKVDNKEKALLIILFLLIPIFVNSVIFVISDAKLQLLMSASYLTIYIFFISLLNQKYIKITTYILLAILLRNYFIQDQATYLTLENTFNTYHTVINTAINNYINELDNKFIIIGEYDDRSELVQNISNSNYGYISDSSIFWEEHHLRKLGFERFTSEYFGLNLEYASEEDYEKVKDILNYKFIYSIDNIVIINFDNYKEKNYHQR